MARLEKCFAKLVATDDPRCLRSMMVGYLEWLQVKGYAVTTVNMRKVYLSYFANWCDCRGLTYPSEITKPILERYHRFLFHYRKVDGEPLTFRSQKAFLLPLKGFFRWLSKENHILSNPASELELPPEEKRIPRCVLTHEEVEQVFAEIDLETALGIRDRAIMETFYATGIRRSEMAHLSISDVDMGRETLLIREGKGRKDRIIPLGERALAWIRKYRDEVRSSLVVPPDPKVLFLTKSGEEFLPHRLTQMVRTYIKAADLGKSGACHLFRHTLATLMLENGADIRFIQQMLGHARLETTQIYTQVSIRQLQMVYKASHPAAKLERSPQDTETFEDTEKLVTAEEKQTSTTKKNDKTTKF
ncbi:MAG: site-specific tyrosine recombinase XerC [Candidatus Riflebacteria bacterium]|nr:site-specific tyrosine recombinase XerC [Candidatus Riflebacteria bacterium]